MVERIKRTITDRIFSTHTQSIASAAVILGVTTLISSILGLVRQRLLVSTFGVGDTLDAYFAAFQVPNLAYNLLISATLSVAFIPVFCEYLEKDKEEAWRIANSVLNLTIVVMGLLSLVFFIAAPLFVRAVSPGFSGEKYALTVDLTRILMLSPWLFSISSIFSSMLNSFRSFILVALAPLIYNIAIILGIIFCAPFWGIYGVAASVIAGALLHILIQVPGARKLGFRWKAAIALRHRGVRQILALIVPRILAIDASQISQLVGTVIGSTLLVGSVAIFNLVFNIESLPIGIFALSFVVSVFPSLSGAAARNDLLGMKRDFSYTARQILFFLIPLSVLTYVFRAQIVRLIIGSRNLSWDETRLAASMLAIFSVSFIFQGLTPLFSRVFFSLKNTTIPLVVSLFSIVINVLGTYVFLFLLSRDGTFTAATIATLRLEGITDIRSLALPFGFSLASCFNVLALFVMVRFKFKNIDLDIQNVLYTFFKYTIASLISGFVGYGVLYGVEPHLDTHSFLGITLQLSVATTIAFLVFGLISFWMRSEELLGLLHALNRKMGRSVKVLDTTSVDRF